MHSVGVHYSETNDPNPALAQRCAWQTALDRCRSAAFVPTCPDFTVRPVCLICHIANGLFAVPLCCSPNTAQLFSALPPPHSITSNSSHRLLISPLFRAAHIARLLGASGIKSTWFAWKSVGCGAMQDGPANAPLIYMTHTPCKLSLGSFNCFLARRGRSLSLTRDRRRVSLTQGI